MKKRKPAPVTFSYKDVETAFVRWHSVTSSDIRGFQHYLNCPLATLRRDQFKVPPETAVKIRHLLSDHWLTLYKAQLIRDRVEITR